LQVPFLEDFLNKKPLFYNKIDKDRMPKAFDSLNKQININIKKVIHIVGTNAKGSCGRFLSGYLYNSGFKVLHYSSPHIFEFNERIWLDGENIQLDVLEKYHTILYKSLEKKLLYSLSYFEYTTLLTFVISHFLDIDYLVLEAGLGGEDDATSVINSDYTLITPIDIDHKEFLGDSIEQIATAKVNAVKKIAIIGVQKNNIVKKIANNILKEKQLVLKDINDILDVNLLYKEDELLSFISRNNLASFQIDNLKLVIATIFEIYKKNQKIDYDIFYKYKMPYRCEYIQNNICVDVGHNILGASVILEHFLAKNKKISLIYNSLSNKDYDKILYVLMPIINEVYYIPINDERMVSIFDIDKCIKHFNIKVKVLENIDDRLDYLVFGSFLVVENFLKRFR
jgi:dihydrofolate synthase/folylpolyglutamate synthase